MFGGAAETSGDGVTVHGDTRHGPTITQARLLAETSVFGAELVGFVGGLDAPLASGAGEGFVVFARTNAKFSSFFVAVITIHQITFLSAETSVFVTKVSTVQGACSIVQTSRGRSGATNRSTEQLLKFAQFGELFLSFRSNGSVFGGFAVLSRQSITKRFGLVVRVPTITQTFLFAELSFGVFEEGTNFLAGLAFFVGDAVEGVSGASSGGTTASANAKLSGVGAVESFA